MNILNAFSTFILYLVLYIKIFAIVYVIVIKVSMFTPIVLVMHLPSDVIYQFYEIMNSFI